MVESLCYLGVTISEGLSFKQHVRNSIRTARDAIYQFRRYSGNAWGYNFHNLRCIYKGIFEGILAYATPVWAHLLQQKTVRAVVLRGRRAALLLVTKAFRTVSTEALQVVAGVMPADLMLRMRSEIYHARNGHSNETETAIRTKYYEEWQTQWSRCTKGRHTYSIWPEIRDRLKAKIINVDLFLTQVYTGHGRFNSKLYDMNIVQTPHCAICGYPEDTLEHAIWTCPSVAALKRAHRGGAANEEMNLPQRMMDPNRRQIFCTYAQAALEFREKTGEYSRSAETRT
ncbi:UNVERIFIED_CONTAM: hypothetical protein PYX00_011193 [Menopon gallinae]|uniref:Reverse transcriptase n=1 Tax=Menopon gallinae TaxID=328185 RepID=A0AAW2H6J3_9NEOP